MNKAYKFLLAGSVVAIGAMGLMANSINGKETEREAINTFPVIKENGVEARNDLWKKYYPREYDSWKKTIESDVIDDQLIKNPQLAILWAGYGFAKDYNAPRGHYYAVQDNINSLRTGAPTGPATGPMPTACWTCKSPDVARLIDEDGENEYFTGKWARYGDQVVNPIGCGTCHDSQDGSLTITRPYLERGLESIGVDPKEVSFQEMRSLVCAQCHVEYYFKATEYTDKKGETKTAKVVTLPWAEGLTAENMEDYYNGYGFTDWTNKLSKAPMLKAQHPGYEIASQGAHALNGVACADCHMPYKQEGAVKYSDHHIGNPLDDIANTCLNCHKESEKEFKARVHKKFERKDELNQIAMNTLAAAHLEAAKAWEVGATEDEMEDVLETIRSAQWLWDYSIASHASFFHAPEETLRLLGKANNKGNEARIALTGILAKYGVLDYQVPDFSTKEKAQALAGVPFDKLVEEKKAFKAGLYKEWIKTATKEGRLAPDAYDGMKQNSSWSE